MPHRWCFLAFAFGHADAVGMVQFGLGKVEIVAAGTVPLSPLLPLPTGVYGRTLSLGLD